jgi:hypothetical protein
VIDLGARVRTDLDTLAEIERTIDVPATLMMSASYAKAFAANQTAQDTADETTGQIALYDARIAALQAKMPKAFGPSPALLEAQRQSAIAQAAYSALAKQLADVSAEQAQLAANPAVVVAGNVTDDTVLRLGERLAIEFAAAVALAFLVLGILLAILIYVLDDRLVTTQQITKLYAKPVIATLKPKS